MTVNINNKDVELKYGNRAMLMYENIMGQTPEVSNLTQVMTFFYCIVVSSAKDYSITFDDFMDWVDDKMDIMQEFAEWLQNNTYVQNFIKKNSKKK